MIRDDYRRTSGRACDVGVRRILDDPRVGQGDTGGSSCLLKISGSGSGLLLPTSSEMTQPDVFQHMEYVPGARSTSTSVRGGRDSQSKAAQHRPVTVLSGPQVGSPGGQGHVAALQVDDAGGEHAQEDRLLLRPPEAAELTDDDKARLDLLTRAEPEMSGYARIQGTRPQTLAYALTDSPVGQLAWIVEKFKEWTDCIDIPEDAVTRDRLLTNVMLYWLTATAGSSARHYWEAFHPPVHHALSRWKHRPAWQSSRPTWPAPSDNSPNGTTTSSTGRSSTAAATSPQWKNPTCSPTTSAPSSNRSADAPIKSSPSDTSAATTHPKTRPQQDSFQ